MTRSERLTLDSINEIEKAPGYRKRAKAESAIWDMASGLNDRSSEHTGTVRGQLHEQTPCAAGVGVPAQRRWLGTVSGTVYTGGDSGDGEPPSVDVYEAEDADTLAELVEDLGARVSAIHAGLDGM